MNDCGHLVTCQHGNTFCGQMNSWLRRISLERGSKQALQAVEQRMNRHFRQYHLGDDRHEVEGKRYCGWDVPCLVTEGLKWNEGCMGGCYLCPKHWKEFENS